MLAEWPLDPAITYLNHGTVGVTPRRIQAAQRELRELIERQPAQFMVVGFVAGLQQRHPDDAIAGERVGEHRAIPRLEDVQRQEDVREQHDVRQRKDRQQVGHQWIVRVFLFT